MAEHFRLDGAIISELSDIGEATLRILQMNAEDLILEREVLHKAGQYPSEMATSLIRIQ